MASSHPPNRLAASSSPYLLQHAHNPVDWHPWDAEAIAEARRRDVPIFLSIGYSTCYWCHVMERESFESPDTAAVMNRLYVNIKVDREERPDLDDVYMAAVQMMTGSGGWPMSVFIDPHTLKPFFGGTYFPPTPAHGRPSFTQVLTGLSDAWATKREEIVRQADALAGAVAEHLAARSEPVLLGPEDVQRACSTLLTIHDRVNGGFGNAPKFPQPVYLELLMAARRRAGDEATRDALDQVIRRTLEAMALGGIHDHAGGGFHRYSVDAQWIVPHFEKMLYDQAQLLTLYARAARLYGDAFFADVARRIVTYLTREMRHVEGGFFSAQDAEVDGREGLNYLWLPAEIAAAIPDADLAAFASDVLGLDDGPNFRDPHHPDDTPRNVLRLRGRPEALAAAMNVTTDEFNARLARARDALLAARAARKPARLDDKVIASWNGLMIGALADAAEALGETTCLDLARDAATFVMETMRDDGGGLIRAWRDGVEGGRAALEDYAAMIRGLTRLAIAETDRAAGEHWVNCARELLAAAVARFSEDGQTFFDTPSGARDLFVRARSTYDGAMPSAASMLLVAIVDLHRITADAALASQARGVLAGVSAAVKESPVSTALATVGLLELLNIDAAAVKESLSARGAVRRVVSGMPQVEVLASVSEVHVADDHPGTFRLRLTIPAGMHINAFDAGEASGGVVVPLRVGVVGGDGLNVFADYPTGEPMPDAAHRVHGGEIEFDVAIEKSGDVTGSPRLVLTYQLCTDDACFAPMSVELDLRIEVQ